MLSREPADPTEPIESTEPADPIDRHELTDPMLSTLSRERQLRMLRPVRSASASRRLAVVTTPLPTQLMTCSRR
jgi:hypothetical protein